MRFFLPHTKTNAANIDSKPNSNRRTKYFLMLLLPFFVILAQAPFVAVWGQTISRPIRVPGTICMSSSPSTIVVYSILTGFPQGTVFTAEFSELGNFTDAIPVGTGTNNNNPGAVGIFAMIPGDLEAGSQYRIRISGQSVTSLPRSITVAELPGPTVTLTTRDISGCAGPSDGMITGSATGGSGAGYTWSYRLEGSSSVVPMPTGTASNLAPGIYAVTATDAGNFCTSSVPDTLIATPIPVIEVSTKGNVSECGSDNGFFTLKVGVASSDPPGRDGIYSLQIKPWIFQITEQAQDTTGVPWEQKAAVVRFGDLAQGAYKVKMKDGAGCESNTIENIEISTDNPLELVLGGYRKPGCGASDGNITVKPTGGSGNAQRYSLSTDGGANFGPEQTGRRFGNLAADDYTIMVRDSRGCTATLDFTLTEPASCTPAIAGSTSDLNLMAKNPLKLQVLPNPTRTTFSLNLQTSSSEKVQIIVTDMFGKKLFQTTGSSNQQYTFGREFKSGMYIVQVVQGKQIQTLKLVKGN